MHRNHGTRWRGAAGGLAVLIASATLVSPNALAGITPKVKLTDKHSQIKPLKSDRDRKTQMTNVSYTQDVRSDGEAVTVTLNGWPVSEMSGGQDTGLINYAVIDGTNHLSVTIAPPPDHKKTHTVDKASALIQKDDATVFSFKWRADAEPPQPLPLHKEITFQSGTHFGPRAWQNAPKITLDTATKEAIRAQAHRFRDILNTKSLDGMAKMFAVRDHDQAISYGETQEQNTAEARADYQEMLARPDWRMEPVHDAQMQFHLLADNRVVLVDYGLDNEVLETVPDSNGDTNGFYMYLCLLDGQWTIVR